MDSIEPVKISPIGFFRCAHKDPVEVPRQPGLDKNNEGFIELSPELPTDCLDDLEGFSHLWVIFQFHNNQGWRPKVQPPRGKEKRGVFSTRAPYRPNPIGLSVVELKQVVGHKVFVKSHDLLDGSPILDIKPYLSYCDSKPEAALGWVGVGAPVEEFKVIIGPGVMEPLTWLSNSLGIDLASVLQNQLGWQPTNSKIKRVLKKGDHWTFSYKTWRFNFLVKNRGVSVFGMGSGYTKEELNSGSEDPWSDKNLHRQFLKKFSD